MTVSFFSDGLALGDRIARAPHVLLGLDYDGTLTRIVDDPTQATLSTPMRRVLWSLAMRRGVSLAIVSGRSYKDLHTRIGLGSAIYAGNHGLEIRGPDFDFIEPAAAIHSEAINEIAADLRHRLRHIPGVIVEDKGLTLSVHYRRVAPIDSEEVWHTVLALVNNAEQLLHLTMGNKVYEIRPHLRWHKGSAMHWIRQHFGKADTMTFYLGDDTTDEDAFTTLTDAITIKVGANSDTAARYRLIDPDEVQHFLAWVDNLRS